MKTWVYDPHSGGVKIPTAVRERTEKRIQDYANKHYAGKFTRLGIRFRGALCYIDAFTEPQEPSPELLRITGESREQFQFLERLRNMPTHLCRLRYFGNEENGAWPFTPIAMNGMNPVRSITEHLTVLPKRRSK
ncbi:MAG: hypothetical protein JWL77_1861 [Chthonomonadaceae bacterium]|nr:hypothetical protein [Chthonomonadaceae bacterium]